MLIECELFEIFYLENMPVRLSLLFLMAGLLFSPVFGQKKIFIDPNGNDRSSGSFLHPVATVQQAILLASQSNSGKVELLLRKGVYYLDTTILFNAVGFKGKSVLLAAFNNEAVVISGAKKVAVHWNKFSDNIYVAKVSVDFTPDAMFVNGKQLVMARYPNYDSTARVFNGVAADAISEQRVKKWKDPAGGFFHALHSGEWGSFHYRILGKRNDGSLQLEGGWQNNRPAPLHTDFRFVENIFEELDAPGEWYFDKVNQQIYYYPQSETDLEAETVELSRLKTLLYLKGDESSLLKNISIRKIKFTQTKRVLMEAHEPLLRSDWMLHRSGALLLEGTQHCAISDCVFDQLGATAIMVSGFNKETNISNNHFKELGGSGVCFVGDVSAVRSPAFKYEQFLEYKNIDQTPGPQNNRYPKNGIVYNNLIHDIGRIEKQATGVEISMSESITVKNNTIYNTPRAGINIGDGTWGGHLIEYNEVFNTVQETGDHGSFNSWGRDRYWNADRKYMDSIVAVHPEIILLDAQKTTIIRNNRFRCDHGWDIDLDDGSSNYHIYNNICLNGGIKLREGFYRTVENNIMINNSFHPHVWFKQSGDVFRKNIVTRNYYPIVIPYWGKEVDANLFVDSASLVKARKNHTDKNSLFGDPLFVNPSKGDFRVSAKSLALQIGFKNMDVSHIGVQGPLKSLALPVPIPFLMIPSTVSEKAAEIAWLDVVVRNVQGMGDRSAFGLSAENGVVIVSVSDKKGLTLSGLQPKDVLLAADDTPINNIFDLFSHYQRVNWQGKMKGTIMRSQQIVNIIIQLK
jgi:hypothetical protein